MEDDSTPPPTASAAAKWRCIDDGTGKNVLYVSDTGEKRRKEPPEYVMEMLDELPSRRKFIFKGSCVRCRKRAAQVAMSIHGSVVFSVNYCEDCLLIVTAPLVPNIKRLRSQGQAVFESTLDAPMTVYTHVKERTMEADRETRLIELSKQLKYNVSVSAKLRRNAYRYNSVLNMKQNLGVKDGIHISWGFDNNAFDEFFGQVNALKQPHGLGVRFYSDGSTYVG
jgi:hypothetical protein